MLRIILDECLPRRLAKDFSAYEVATVPEAGFAGYKNGKLLKAIENNFDVFITVDSNLEYQQHLQGYNITVIILKAKSNRYDELTLLVPDVIKLLKASPGNSVIIVG